MSSYQDTFPLPAPTGRPRADDRNTINGILYVLTTGCRWMDMPRRYGSDSTAHRGLQLWEQNGTWKKILDAARSKVYLTGKLSMENVQLTARTLQPKKGTEHWLRRPQGRSRHKDTHALTETLFPSHLS